MAANAGNEMNRQGNTARAVLAGLAFVIWLLLFQGNANRSAAGDVPQRTGTLRLARLSDPVTLDPAKVIMSEDFLLVPLLHQSLLDVKDGVNLVPKAARDWSASPDRRVYTFHLRPGVRFSTGREVTASDYVFAFEYILNPTNAAAASAYLMGIRGAAEFTRGTTNHLAGTAATAPDTLVIQLEHSDPTFGYVMASSPGIAIPAEDIARLGSRFSVTPVGDGPYMLHKWQRGSSLQLVRNPHYHGVEPQHLDGMEMLIGGDEATHLMMFERGELDIANLGGEGIPFPSFRRLSHDPKWRDLIEYAEGLSTLGLYLNVEVPPFTNVMVRRAVSHAINRDKWMRVTTHHSTHAEGLIPPIMPGFNPKLKGYEYDPGKARALLAESGLPRPLRTTFWHDTADAARFLALGVQADLKQVGIEAELKAVTYSQLVSAASIRGQVPMSYSGWGAIIPDPMEILGLQFDGRAITNTPTLNLCFYQNAEVDRLLDLAAPEVDWKKRFGFYQRAEELIVRDAPMVFLGHVNTYALRQRRLKGPLIEPLYGYRLDRVWIE